MRKIKMGFLSDVPPSDRSAWSGTKYRIYEQLSLCKELEISWIPARYSFGTFCYKLFLFLYTRLLGKRYSLVHSRVAARQVSRSIDRKLVESVDLLFVASGSLLLYDLETEKPILYLTDATFASLYGYYPLISRFLPFNVKQGNEVERIALDKAWKIIASSDWCKDSIVKDYSIDPGKIEVIEFGANVNENDIRQQERSVSDGRLHLLFLGVDWERKGGDVAVDCVRHLNGMGLPSVLHVVGTDVPGRYRTEGFIEAHGFLHKNNPEEYRLFLSLISRSDLLLLPTRAECAGVAFCEASAYGLPSFTYDTGGIPNYVENGVNGYRLPLSAGGADFAQRIRSVIENKELPVLVEGCKRLYDSRLSWTVWRSKFENILKSL